jgi:hypothetical protein
MPSGLSLVGRKYGALRVLKETRNQDIYLCSCSKCGGTIKAFRSSLTKGVILDCGCTWTKRGRRSPYFAHRRFLKGRDGLRNQRTSSELNSFMSMKSRCLYTTTTGFQFWGGRGIQICPEWLEPKGQGFANFLHALGPRPVGMTLGRKNPNGHYEPGNVFWETDEEQHYNKRPVLWPGGEGEPPVVPMELDEDLACM